MFVSSLAIKNFKRIQATVVPLAPITIIVGGNNSGKSCVLQAAHFAVNLLQARLAQADDTIPSERLRYLPTGDILDLPHGGRLTSGAAPVEVIFGLKDHQEAEEARLFPVSLNRGEGLTVKLDVGTDEAAEARLSDLNLVFSIYVPGLAGIPLQEEYRSDSIISSAIARGDANLFLRNILLRISQNNDKMKAFESQLDSVLPGSKLVVTFDHKSDVFIDVRIDQDGRLTPLDAVGTGVLQYIQLMAYVTAYNPVLVLLDEPDAHLHPNNQRVIAKNLIKIASDMKTQVVIATHSRTLLDAFSEVSSASFVWMEAGEVQQETDKDHISMLMKLGALDGGERFYSDNCTTVFLTEDTYTDYIEPLLMANGIDPAVTHIHSYETSSKLQSAFELAKFIKRVKPAVRVIVHRDRDFMPEDDVGLLAEMYNKGNKDITLFVTAGSDIEHYFTDPKHIAAAFGIPVEDAEKIVDDVIEQNKVNIAIDYVNKVGELKWIYNILRKEPPSTKPIRAGVKREHAIGKDLAGKIIEAVQGNPHSPKAKLLIPRETLVDPVLRGIANEMAAMENNGGQCA